MPLPLLPEQAELEASFDEALTQELGALDFAAALPAKATPQQLNATSTAILKYLLQSGDNGYKDGVDTITDAAGNPPGEANAWLYDAEDQAFSGRFVDRRDNGDRVFEFKITKDGDGWSRSFRPLSGVEGN